MNKDTSTKYKAYRVNRNDHLTRHLSSTLKVLQEISQEEEREIRAFRTIGVVQSLLLYGLSGSPQLTKAQKKLALEINGAGDQALGLKTISPPVTDIDNYKKPEQREQLPG